VWTNWEWSRKRLTGIMEEDVIFQTELRVAVACGYESYLCLCRKCHGGHKYGIESIQEHLRMYGKDINLLHSMLGGDPPQGYPPEGLWIDHHGRPIHVYGDFENYKFNIPVPENLDP
jgi:hypothetical protein